MQDIIRLLPDSLANQIAAGEVVQRPSSIVKELLENAIDAKATNISLIIKDSGRTLVQVIDNGIGMSATDARLCWERHATSKIKSTEDLFRINTMGFRGEALASIAAVAQVEMKTKRELDDLGTEIHIEDSEVKKQSVCQSPTGTTIMVKNLFYNVPARRQFLKSNQVEFRHILDEFQRIALAHYGITFSLYHNGNQLYHLNGGSLAQRIVTMFGKGFQTQLVPMKEDTDLVSFMGYVGRPESSKKQRGEQFFFVNNRFIKSGYLQHAVFSAYEELIPDGTFPFFAIFITIDPTKVDVNVHPTKQEIKFEDEKIIYNYLRVSSRHALGQYLIRPLLDFDSEQSIEQGLNNNLSTSPNESKIEHNFYEPPKRDSTSFEGLNMQGGSRKKDDPNLKYWESLYQINKGEPKQHLSGEEDDDDEEEFDVLPSKNNFDEHERLGSKANADNPLFSNSLDWESVLSESKEPMQVGGRFIVLSIRQGLLVIDQKSAHERILFDHYVASVKNKQVATQQLLFPVSLRFTVQESEELEGLVPLLQSFGVDISRLGNQAFVINGLPPELKLGSEEMFIKAILARSLLDIDVENELIEQMALTLAQSASVSRGQLLHVDEMKDISQRLFESSNILKSPSGKKIWHLITPDQLEFSFN